MGLPNANDRVQFTPGHPFQQWKAETQGGIVRRMGFPPDTKPPGLKDKQGTIAKAPARAEKRERDSQVWDVTLAPKGDGVALTRLAFPGDKQALVVGEASAKAGPAAGTSTAGPQ